MNAMYPAEKKRNPGIDFARAVAVSGMIIEHFNQVNGSASMQGPDWLLWLTGRMDGRSAVLFVILAGMGMSLAGESARGSGDVAQRRAVRSILLRRASVLFVVGLIFHFVWESDILHYFGIFIALGSLVLFVPSRWLWTGAVLLNLTAVVMLLGFNSSEMWCYDAGWDWEAFRYVDFWTPAGFIRNLFINGCFPVFPWMGFLFVGIWMGRQNLRNPKVLQHCVIGGLAVACVADLSSWLLTFHIGPRWLGIPAELSSALFGRYLLPPGPLFFTQAAATAIFITGCCLILAKRLVQVRWMKPWFLLGQYSLSVYIGHLVLLIVPLAALGWIGQRIAVTLSEGIAAIGLSLLVCMLWSKRFRHGPLEMAIRRLSQMLPHS